MLFGLKKKRIPGGGGWEVLRRHATPCSSANGEDMGTYSVIENTGRMMLKRHKIAARRRLDGIYITIHNGAEQAAGGRNGRVAVSQHSFYWLQRLLIFALDNCQGQGNQAGRQKNGQTARRTWMRSSSWRRTAFQTRMSAMEHVMNRSEQPAGKITSFTRAK